MGFSQCNGTPEFQYLAFSFITKRVSHNAMALRLKKGNKWK